MVMLKLRRYAHAQASKVQKKKNKKKEIFRDKSGRFIQRRQSLLRIHQRCTCI
ncbi:hypothetical protein LINPERPRIM_LOCUS24742 [Linum perenne]